MTSDAKPECGAEEMARDEIARLRAALIYAKVGFDLAYSAAEGHRNDEVLLHCGHHEAMISKALGERE